mmetsp:Transcript_19299/g.24903  ORF Transcript_19299/g.24903 Transcript_19299/m.24903 type:complete len:128 (+) Transcript_19299:40-423(+)|eukprot:CAMPEP_0198142726 /NCGR_PEP_ID=MMETSP1443-20131203/5443_1 /TAXON_ID=186043 /ORGANISM="Entomoneis sp., Strain CCMP2396" /LENGTH=127 /DNA_ID=CAMNT_0043805805 /DNA_START=31 /DNA_END=414 /DNA_ORIENTATION=-
MIKAIFTGVLFFSLFALGSAFQPMQHSVRLHVGLKAEKKGGFNPITEFSDMMSNLDQVIDDFMGKRMGNGEVFYGKRKYKPSGRDNTEGQYDGMGMSDKYRIDTAREKKEEYLAMKEARAQQLKRDN